MLNKIIEIKKKWKQDKLILLITSHYKNIRTTLVKISEYLKTIPKTNENILSHITHEIDKKNSYFNLYLLFTPSVIDLLFWKMNISFSDGISHRLNIITIAHILHPKTMLYISSLVQRENKNS